MLSSKVGRGRVDPLRGYLIRGSAGWRIPKPWLLCRQCGVDGGGEGPLGSGLAGRQAPALPVLLLVKPGSSVLLGTIRVKGVGSRAHQKHPQPERERLHQ
jgi:hypothetical protein